MDNVGMLLVFLALAAVSPFLAIAAMVNAGAARRETRRLRDELEALKASLTAAPATAAAATPPRATAVATPAAPAEPAPPAATPAAPATPAVPATPEWAVPPAPTPPSSTAPPPPPPAKTAGFPAAAGDQIEVALGGKVASFAGIAILVLGIAYFVGYAIQKGFLGQGMRVLLGLVSGVVLIGIGYLCATRGRNLGLLARVLTGGGSALLYFSVFAAHGFYDLIGPVAAAAGLTAVAVAALTLAVAYSSQSVAILGVAGAFITPLAVGGRLTEGVFALAYIGVLNISVLLLGQRRNWQWLANLAFVGTVIFTTGWIYREVHGPGSRPRGDLFHWAAGLAALTAYFLIFVGVGMAKLKARRGSFTAVLDGARLLAASLVLMGGLYWLLDIRELNHLVGVVFFAAALLHLGLVRLAWSRLPRFVNEVLVLMAGGVNFAVMALPAQFDGVWVSLGWSVEGLILAWLGVTFRVQAFRMGGVVLGLLGLGRTFTLDVQEYNRETTRLFFNSRFLVGALSSGLLAAQSWLAGRTGGDGSPERAPGRRDDVADGAALLAAMGLVLTVGTDGLHVLGRDDLWGWLLSSVALLAAGLPLLVAGRLRNSHAMAAWGFLMVLLVPVKLIAVDFFLGWAHYHSHSRHLLNGPFLVALALVLALLSLSSRLGPAGGSGSPGLLSRPAMLQVTSIVAGIAMVTLEISRAQSAWKDTAITLWWAGCALALILTGLVRGRRLLRYTGLTLFGVTILKVFAVDMSGLGGLVRVAAFIGVGVILLVLSYVYQRLAPRFSGSPASKSAVASSGPGSST